MRLTGSEHIKGLDFRVKDDTVLDFWQWAFSDLQANNVRGIFAEWLVAKLLGIPLTIRDSWVEWDLVTPGGVKIEVKASAYLQSWEQRNTSKIVFTGLKGRTLNTETNQYAPKSTYNADIYVFCVQIEQSREKWDAFNLDQWRFYLLPKKQLEMLDQNTLSLNPLRKMCQELRVDEFCKEAVKLIKSVQKKASEYI
jgi:hypothetical protein